MDVRFLGSSCLRHWLSRWITAAGAWLLTAVCAFGQLPARESQIGAKTTPYFQAVLRCLDTLITEGTDRYGTEHSPLFSSILDLKTHRLPDQPPPLLPGQRAVDRAFPGANLQHDLHTLLVMDHVSKLTGDDRYRKAADAYLEFFLRRCATAGNGLFPCGEHAFWDFRKEAIGGAPLHEDLGLVPAEFLDRMWALQPAAVEKHIRGLKRHFLEGQWIWNRHASIVRDERPREPAAFPRHGGFYLYHWVYLYTKTRDPELLEWSRQMARPHPGPYHSLMSLGLSILRANELLGAERLPEFDTVGRKCLDPLVADPRNDLARGVVWTYTLVDPARKTQGDHYRPDPNRTYGFWDMIYAGSGGYGFVGAETHGIMCLAAYRITSSEKHLEFAKGICNFYLTHPRPSGIRVTPGKLAGQIALALDLYDLTKCVEYRTHARQTADTALQELYTDGLIRAATGADYYEAANGVGSLLMELFRMHLVETGSDYPLPRNYHET